MISQAMRISGVVVLALILAPSAQATYIDPGSGSILLQAILAAVFGAAVTIRCFWQRIKMTLFGAPKNSEKKSEDIS